MWLVGFPNAPSMTPWLLDLWLRDIPPYLARMPVHIELPVGTRQQLRELLESFAADLLRQQKADDYRSVIEWSGTGASAWGWWSGIEFLEPVTMVATVVFGLRNARENRKWKHRRQALVNIADQMRRLKGRLA